MKFKQTVKKLFNNMGYDVHKMKPENQSIPDAIFYRYPRLQNGGFMVFDDYGFPQCPGARRAVDEFFREKHEVSLVLPTGQAVIFRWRSN